MNLIIKPDDLLIFADETGSESLTDQNHPVFGIGGCAALGADYDEIIRTPWIEIKRQHFGNPNMSLHAADLPTPLPKEQLQAFIDFFNSRPFTRWAAILKKSTQIPAGWNHYQALSYAVLKRIEQTASRYSAFQRIVLIFESSDRANHLAEKYFGEFTLTDNDNEGQEISVERYFMAKSLCEPGLEVADFIIHTVGGQARQQVQGKQGWRKDFELIFRGIDSKLTSFINIDDIKFNPTSPATSPSED